MTSASIVSVPPCTSQPSSSTSALSKVATGPVPPKFDRSDFQAPTIAECRAVGIGTWTSPGKLDLLFYCSLKGRCPHCRSAVITANSVGKRKVLSAFLVTTIVLFFSLFPEVVLCHTLAKVNCGH